MKFNVKKLVFFDIESVSQYENLEELPKREREMWESYYDSFRKRVTDESRIDPEVMTGKEIKQEVYRQTAAFFPEFGKVACVSLGLVDENGPRYESYYGEDEMDILRKTRETFNSLDSYGFELCGQSIKMFDVPFLGKRYFINGLKPPTIFPTHETKPWEYKMLDTKEVWQFGNNWSLSSLDLQCTVLNIDSPKNGDVKGDSVTTNYWSGKHEEIKEYCERDVKALIDIVEKLNNLQ